MTDTSRTLHRQAALAVGRPAPHIPPRQKKAHIIQNDGEAIAIAKALAREFAAGAVERDRERRLPIAEIERASQSGLWAITVPREYGGAGVSAGTLAEVTALLSETDSNIGQIPQNHYYMVEALRLAGTIEQKRHYFRRILDGDRLGNAFTEIGTRTPVDYKTRFTARDGRLLLNGQKFYSTGSLFAHIVVAVAKDENDRVHIVFIDRATAGLQLIDDWTGFGQRATGSGSVTFDDVEITPFQVVDHQRIFDEPTPMGPLVRTSSSASKTATKTRTRSTPSATSPSVCTRPTPCFNAPDGASIGRRSIREPTRSPRPRSPSPKSRPTGRKRRSLQRAS